jgi:hypothetical protein
VPLYSGGQEWKFTQLGGDKKELLLAGLDAPFGRPRKKPVVTDKVEIRETLTYYPGTTKPTRHIFGAKYDPWELQGRIGDRNFISSNPSQVPAGIGYAKAFVDYIKKFVSDQQPVRVAWGNIISAEGFIKSFEPRREAEYEVEYLLTVDIDADETSPTTVIAIAGRRSTKDQVAQVVAALSAVTKKLPSDSGIKPSLSDSGIKPSLSDSGIKPSLLDSIDNLVSSFASATGQLVQVANQIDNIEKALVTDLKRMRAAIGQVRTAALSLQATIDAISIDAATIRRSWSADIGWGGARADSDAAITAALSQLEIVNKQAEIAERGKPNSSYVAKLGDTWELIATNTLGGADKADAIRAANGVRYGQQPEPSRAYKIPFS